MRLLQHNRYDFIETKVPYCIDDSSGELDVWTKVGRYNTYYEVKSSYNHHSWSSAVKQFERLHNANPEGIWRYVYVTPQRVTRYYPRSNEKTPK